MPPNRFESEVESFLEGSHGDRTHIKRADHPRLHHYAGRYWRQPGGGQLMGANACLDYGYSVLRGHLMRAVLAAGLAPALGVFHRGRGNAFALADDLIEPFRPAIDEVALQLPPTASPSDRPVKQLLVAASSQRFDGDGHGIPTVAEALAQAFGRYVEGDIDRLNVLSWQGPSVVSVGD